MNPKGQISRHPRNRKKPNTLFGFFYKYGLTISLLLILISLVKQNFFINQFPTSLSQRQQQIDHQLVQNKRLSEQNEIKKIELKSKISGNQEVLESQARYRFGLIKEGETFYQITQQNP